MKLKKINAVLGLLIVLSLCGHAGTMGFSLWTGWYSFLLCKSLAKITISLLVLHVFCSLCLFFFVHDGAGLKYSKCNVSTILQRISALLILGLLHIHMKAYAHMATGTVLGTGQTAFSSFVSPPFPQRAGRSAGSSRRCRKNARNVAK